VLACFNGEKMGKSIVVLFMLIALSGSAQASDFSFSFGIGGGYWTERQETVLVESGRIERRWIPPVEEVRIDEAGNKTIVVITKGYYLQYSIAPRYEVRIVRIWVRDRGFHYYGHHHYHGHHGHHHHHGRYR
jgi:hypothetical protein